MSEWPFYKAKLREAVLEAMGSVGRARAFAAHWRGPPELNIPLDLMATEDMLHGILLKLEEDRT